MLRPNEKNKLEVTIPSRGPDISGLESPVLDDIDFFGGGKMSGNGPSSPFIKDEPDWDFHGTVPNQQHVNMHMQNQQYPQVASGSIDPNDLQAHHQNDHFAGFNFNQTQSGSFNIGNSNIADDELASLDLRHNQAGNNMSDFTFDQPHHGNQGQDLFSSTPNGEPIQSPFLQNNFQFYQQSGSHMVSPRMRPQSQGGQMDGFNFNTGPRHSLPHAMERKVSETARSPMTPKTPALAGLTIGGTPESSSLSSQPMNAMHRRQKTLSGQWDNSPGSLSYMDSPLGSPSNPNHTAISEVLKHGKGMSLPTSKIDHHQHSPAYQTQEAKRRRRRESHNLVERRRRDNINERIQELSHLVPQHRLEDEKVRKFLANNGPLSPSIIPGGVSPPQATSMLAAGGRRATGPGNITMGLPAVDDKDKGPNKGDILNGSVSWTRDLMWALHKKLEQEAKLKELIESMGQTFPFTDSEDDARMRTELADAMDKNDASTFDYSRGHGSGLRVPKHTDHAGAPVPAGHSEHETSPGGPGGSSASGNSGSAPFWAGGNAGQSTLKEEDEFDMNMS